jgi:thiamine-phosphate pyrophosphorylase
VTPVICLITDRRRDAGNVDATVERVRWAARAGVHLVQVRERNLDGGPLTALVRRCVEAVGGSRTRVLVNDRLDVALAAGAHGVHLRGDSMPAARVRQLCPPGFLLGRSVHARDEAVEAAAAGGLDYLLFGTVFTTLSKPGRAPAGPVALAHVVQASGVPVLAVGGLSPDNIGQVAAAGAAGFAAIGLLAAASEADLVRSVGAARAAFAAPSRK